MGILIAICRMAMDRAGRELLELKFLRCIGGDLWILCSLRMLSEVVEWRHLEGASDRCAATGLSWQSKGGLLRGVIMAGVVAGRGEGIVV